MSRKTENVVCSASWRDCIFANFGAKSFSTATLLTSLERLPDQTERIMYRLRRSYEANSPAQQEQVIFPIHFTDSSACTPSWRVGREEYIEQMRGIVHPATDLRFYRIRNPAPNWRITGCVASRPRESIQEFAIRSGQ